LLTTAPRLPFSGVPPRLRWLLLALLFAAATVFAANATPSALAQTAPPGPQLGSGDFINPQNRGLEGSWDAFPADNPLGEVLYVWNIAYVSVAEPCSAAGVATVCFAWRRYLWDPTDPYDTALWVPFSRGCMLLGANPPRRR
jgi:hypothetical protein